MKELVLFAMLAVMPVVDGAGPQRQPSVQPQAELEEPPEPLQDEQSLAALPIPPVTATPDEPHEICRVGLVVMIPDGREGRVTSREQGICRVLAYGEGYVSLWPEDLVEPVYPQYLPVHRFGH